ncbi:protoporphyrinogen oxidase, partial [Stackebrandtia soli]|uniref:protoporphyrinogen oxidase n=1 Tax=Stackebrandtia soli TaxID=1892856 RepID=UPI0039E828F1
RGGDALTITIVERAHVIGGKLATGELAGATVETGAETFLARRPEAMDLARRVGLGESIVHPARLPAGLVIGDQVHEMPGRTVMGVPADPAAVAASGILSPDGAARLMSEPDGDAPLLDGEDVAVGALVRHRLGDEVVDRLVDPLLGGVYSGRSDDLSMQVTVPGLAAAATRHKRLTDAAAASLPAPADGPPAPVFGTIDGGLSRLTAAVAAHSRADIRLGLPVRRLNRTPNGWRAVVGSTRDESVIDADAVILAVPARPSARLLSDDAPAASAAIGVLDYASIALVTLAIEGLELPQRSGFLVPAGFGHRIKAATFFTRKWPHLAASTPGRTLVRMSIGRYGEESTLHYDDSDLVAAAVTDLGRVLGGPMPTPTASAVRRWGGALPQYGPGHLERIAHARRTLTDHPIALAGAAFDGVGIPACVASGEAAADTLLGALAANRKVLGDNP